MNRDRFPGLAGGWARLDGPAGTQMVDTAIDAMAEFMRSGRGANHGGAFAAAHATDECVADARAAVARLLGAESRGVAFGPSMTAMTMRLSAAVGRTLRPGDEVVCTRIDHDANVRPWVIAAGRAGAVVRFAEPEPDTLALPAANVEAVLSERTRWVAVTAASNAMGAVPDLPGIIAAAHATGARVSVDAVHAAPHRPLDLAALGCDTLACSAYKWFGPHVGILCAAPALLEELAPDKLLPSPDEAPDRAPTLMFNVAGRTSTEVAAALAGREIAVWDGNYYAWELERLLGLDAAGSGRGGGAVRAGFVHYNDEDDVERLVGAVAEVAAGAGPRMPAAASAQDPPA